MTDAAHLLTDFGSILISIFSLWISSRPRSDAMTFGWHRAGELGILWEFGNVVVTWLKSSLLNPKSSADYLVCKSLIFRCLGENWDFDFSVENKFDTFMASNQSL